MYNPHNGYVDNPHGKIMISFCLFVCLFFFLVIRGLINLYCAPNNVNKDKVYLANVIHGTASRDRSMTNSEDEIKEKSLNKKVNYI
jgi:hypothetical protein